MLYGVIDANLSTSAINCDSDHVRIHRMPHARLPGSAGLLCLH